MYRGPVGGPRVGPAGWQNVGGRRSLTKCKLDRVTLNTFPNVHKSQMMVIDNVKATIVIRKEVTHAIILVPPSDKLQTVDWHWLQNDYLVDDSVCKTCQVVEAQIGWGSLSKLIKVIFPSRLVTFVHNRQAAGLPHLYSGNLPQEIFL